MLSLLLWFSAIGCGLIAGLYFAFSAFIMKALGRIDPGAGMAAMNEINKVILGSLFMPLFFGTTIVGAVLAALSLLRWSEPGAVPMLFGGVIYVAGMFGVTLLGNVPLNNELARAKATGDGDADDVWRRYLKAWTFWNHVRTVASTVACGCFIAALLNL
ncbi:DUF1772 domain-containing protein [Aidingimonas halophila]|uniref:Uncharacterized membrane protein n=1 Tax=Aidingimonas halophila TaxID=574349 RepID=A0A1H2ZW95_9GAMM|nr:anthrone oxygenase family protein [Aidingimonas halophila]GHC16867.1 membrane protein [Aidingimonas halophila]SDX21830.1 Uncharacterized membrane protein [Aidingimonas halophila]